MSERALLSLLQRYPHPVAIARHVSGATLSEGVRRLERAGLVARRRGLYRVTERGQATLLLDRALRAAVSRALGA
jgi:DNA-binding MarR family transcriptional regulator